LDTKNKFKKAVAIRKFSPVQLKQKITGKFLEISTL